MWKPFLRAIGSLKATKVENTMEIDKYYKLGLFIFFKESQSLNIWKHTPAFRKLPESEDLYHLLSLKASRPSQAPVLAVVKC